LQLSVNVPLLRLLDSSIISHCATATTIGFINYQSLCHCYDYWIHQLSVTVPLLRLLDSSIISHCATAMTIGFINYQSLCHCYDYRIHQLSVTVSLLRLLDSSISVSVFCLKININIFKITFIKKTTKKYFERLKQVFSMSYEWFPHCKLETWGNKFQLKCILYNISMRDTVLYLMRFI
jgi:hypothetical protein